jgi:hypothetical protein
VEELHQGSNHELRRTFLNLVAPLKVKAGKRARVAVTRPNSTCSADGVSGNGNGGGGGGRSGGGCSAAWDAGGSDGGAAADEGSGVEDEDLEKMGIPAEFWNAVKPAIVAGSAVDAAARATAVKLEIGTLPPDETWTCPNNEHHEDMPHSKKDHKICMIANCNKWLCQEPNCNEVNSSIVDACVNGTASNPCTGIRPGGVRALFCVVLGNSSRVRARDCATGEHMHCLVRLATSYNAAIQPQRPFAAVHRTYHQHISNDVIVLKAKAVRRLRSAKKANTASTPIQSKHFSDPEHGFIAWVKQKRRMVNAEDEVRPLHSARFV